MHFLPEDGAANACFSLLPGSSEGRDYVHFSPDGGAANACLILPSGSSEGGGYVHSRRKSQMVISGS